jgi:hypothetical protein
MTSIVTPVSLAAAERRMTVTFAVSSGLTQLNQETPIAPHEVFIHRNRERRYGSYA